MNAWVSLVGSLAMLLILLSGFCWTVGARQIGGRLFMSGLALAFFGPLVGGLLVAIGTTIPTILPTFEVGVVVALVIIAVALAGVKRFVDRKRAMKAWLRQAPTSKKTRIEPL